MNTISTGTVLDLGSEYLVNGNYTVYTWKTQSGTTLQTGTDYNISNGKTVFLNTQADSVYCEMTNTTFPGFISSNVLKTTCIKVTDPNLPVNHDNHESHWLSYFIWVNSQY